MIRSLSGYFFVPLFFFVILLVYTKLAGPIPFSVNSISTVKQDTFNVSGEGKTFAKPDIALVNLGIQASGPTVKAVQDQINSVSNKVIGGIKSIGVDDNDIKTVNYSINPSYDFAGGSQRVNGYQANSSIQVKVRQIDKTNSVIDSATSNGANQVGGITFDVDDKTAAQNEARKLAVDEAKRKAEQAASIAGFNLGRIVNYQEDFGNIPRPVQFMTAQSADKAPTPPTQVEPGSSEISVIVTLSYEIR